MLTLDGASLTIESVEFQELDIGRSGGNGLLEVRDGGTFVGRTTGASFDNFTLIGTEGAAGAVAVDNATFEVIADGGNAGIRVGIRFTHTEDTTGFGSFVLENGAGAVIDWATGSSVWVGGMQGGEGVATIRSGADLVLAGDSGFAIIDGVFGMIDDTGGTGTLTVTGAGSTKSGMETLVVGFNNGTGTMTVDDGGAVEVGSGGEALFVVGAVANATGNGGIGTVSANGPETQVSMRGTEAVATVANLNSTGNLAFSGGATVEIEGSVSGTLNIAEGANSTGTLSLTHAGTALSVIGEGGAGGDIRVAVDGPDSFGLLHIAAGAVVTGATVTVSAVGSKGVLVLADGGLLGADTIAADGVLGGAGTITGNVVIEGGGSLGAGDTWEVGGGPSDGGWGIGTLLVQGALTQTGGQVFFDMALTPIPDDRTVEFGVSEVTVYGQAMDDQSFEFAYDELTFALTGTVALRGTGTDPTGTQVTFSPDDGGPATVFTVADATGTFVFELAAGTSGTLSVARDYTPGIGAGLDKPLTATDALEVLKMVADLAPVGAGNLDALAADFDGNGTVTATDALEILKHVAMIADAASPEWVLAPNTDLPGGDSGWPEGLSGLPNTGDFAGAQITAMTDDLAVDFTGILRGDMGYYELT